MVSLHSLFVGTALLVLVGVQFCSGAQFETYRSSNDGRCVSSGAGASVLQNLSTSTLTSRQCAVKCLLNKTCSAFSIDSSAKSCLLLPLMSYPQFLTISVPAPGVCQTWYTYWANFAVFTTSGSFTVPRNVTLLKVLAVGGGAGGSICDGGGGASGQVSFISLAVSPNENFTVKIGDGGGQKLAGGNTTFGNSLIGRGGSRWSSSSYLGGIGGSGGGGGSGGSSSTVITSGGGGSAGGSGQSGTSGNAGGSGQGSSFTSYFSQFRLNALSAGTGASGVDGNGNYQMGGGGGGGVMLNGAGPKGGASGCCSGSSWCGPGSATGYGAGGSASCYSHSAGFCASSGSGASGLIYIEYE